MMKSPPTREGGLYFFFYFLVNISFFGSEVKVGHVERWPQLVFIFLGQTLLSNEVEEKCQYSIYYSEEEEMLLLQVANLFSQTVV